MRVGQSRRRDANEKPITKALRALGADVTPVSGEGAPDILVRWHGRLFGFEVKSEKGRQTAAQVNTNWTIIRSVDDALRAIGWNVKGLR